VLVTRLTGPRITPVRARARVTAIYLSPVQCVTVLGKPSHGWKVVPLLLRWSKVQKD